MLIRRRFAASLVYAPYRPLSISNTAIKTFGNRLVEVNDGKMVNNCVYLKQL